LLPLGVLGLLIIGIYTNWITRYPLLCLIAPGLGFGPLMVMGTSYVLMNQYSWAAFLASLTPFFLVSELLLINQFPDVEADKQVGRRHYPITIGRHASAVIYAAFLLLAFAPIAVGAAIRLFPPMTLLGLIPLLAAVPLAYQVLRKADKPAQLTSVLETDYGTQCRKNHIDIAGGGAGFRHGEAAEVRRRHGQGDPQFQALLSGG
jgi:1,4-dihydroxy-2-naphthoate octaprenyltransferase